MFLRRQKPQKSRKGGVSIEGSVAISRDSTMASSEASSDLSLLTKKHRQPTFVRSHKPKDIIAFTAVIDSIDGIIATNTGKKLVNGKSTLPVFAVISYYKKVVSTGNIVKTNMMSMPLVKSTSSIGNRERYFGSFAQDPEPLSVTLSAAMRRDPRFKSGYEPRELNFDISLMRGSEVVKLGTSSLILTGDEKGTIQLLPVSSSKTVTNTVRKAMVANKPSKTNVSNISTTGAKMVSFQDDPTRKYTLQRAVMRVSVHIQDDASAISQYVHGPINNPKPMVLKIENSESVSCLSSGGASTKKDLRAIGTLEKRQTTSSTDYESTIASSYSSTDYDVQNCNGLDILRIKGDKDSDESSDTDSDDESYNYLNKHHKDRYGLNIPHTFSDDDDFTDSDDDNSALLSQVSLGTIVFKGFGSDNGGVEVVSTPNKKKGKLFKTKCSAIAEF